MTPTPRQGQTELPAAAIVREIETLLADQTLPAGVRTRLESLHANARTLAAASHPVIDVQQAKRILVHRSAQAALTLRKLLQRLAQRPAKVNPPSGDLATPLSGDSAMFQQLQPKGGRLSGGLASGVIHCAAAALLLTISPAILKQATAVHRSIVYIAPPVELPPPPKRIIRLPVPQPAQPRATFTPRPPAREIPKPIIEAPPVLAVNAPKPAAIPAPKLVATVPPPPPVQTNVFRQLNAELTPQSAPVTVREAGFDHKPNLVVPAGAPSNAIVTRTGFDQTGTAQPVAQAGVVQTGRFSSGRETGTPAIQGATARTSFDRPVVSASAPERAVAAAPPPRKSVEILEKPKPRYTDDARKAKIEGTVFLEITFTASGQIKVHRVVKGLGYGLDQTAIEAAQQIRFKPATLNGAPVDQTAIVQVLFQISS